MQGWFFILHSSFFIFYTTFALAFRLQPIIKHWRDGRVVDYNGLENRRTERYRGFESLSLRNITWLSSNYRIYTQFYTQKCKIGCFSFLFSECISASILKHGTIKTLLETKVTFFYLLKLYAIIWELQKYLTIIRDREFDVEWKIGLPGMGSPIGKKSVMTGGNSLDGNGIASNSILSM